MSEKEATEGEPIDFNTPSGSIIRVILTNYVLGRGSFGVVYYAYSDKCPIKNFAVKIIYKNKGKASPKMLKEEKEILYSLNSDNIVKLLGEAVLPNGDLCLLMELCNGGDLKNFKECRGGTLSDKEAHFFVTQIIWGIVDHSKRGIMHRDLKLSNIGLNFTELNLLERFQSKEYLENFIKSFKLKGNHQSV